MPFARGGIALSFAWFQATAHNTAPRYWEKRRPGIINGAIALMMFAVALSLLWYAAGY